MATNAVTSESSYSVVRRWPRCKIDIPVRAVVQTQNKTLILPSRGRELNEGGLAVFIGFELPIDGAVEIEFTPAYTNEPVRFPCIIRSRNGYVYGLEFLLGTAEDRARSERVRAMLQMYGL